VARPEIHIQLKEFHPLPADKPALPGNPVHLLPDRRCYLQIDAATKLLQSEDFRARAAARLDTAGKQHAMEPCLLSMHEYTPSLIGRAAQPESQRRFMAYT